MSYNPNIPNPNDFLSDSQGQIKSNFTVANAVMTINHYPFDDATANKGKHKFMQMPENAAPTTQVNEGALYTKVGTSPAETNLFFRAENSGGGGGFEYQMTHVDSALTARFATNTNYQVGPPSITGGWTFLPGGLLLQYGFTAATGTGVTTFPKPFGTACYNVTTTPYYIGAAPNGAASVSILNTGAGLTTTGFTATFNSSSGAYTGYFWVAIGL